MKYTEKDIQIIMEDMGLPRSKAIMILENPPEAIRCLDCEKKDNLNKEEEE